MINNGTLLVNIRLDLGILQKQYMQIHHAIINISIIFSSISLISSPRNQKAAIVLLTIHFLILGIEIFTQASVLSFT